MHVKNTTGVDLVVMPDGPAAEPGEVVEVADEVGARLLEQGWTAAKAPKQTATTTTDPDEES